MEPINGDGYTIKENIYQNNSTYVSYPLIVAGVDGHRQELWNNIILEDINKILKIYSDYAFVAPPEGEVISQQNTLKITYDIKRMDEHYLSILYRADFFSPYAAHPTELIYTTNIDIQNSRRISLGDIILLEKDGGADFASWDLVIKDNETKDANEYQKAVRDYIDGLGKEILKMGFASADIIGPDNYLGIYSYLTTDKVGISISVPNYLGDHVEFEQPIAKSDQVI